MTDDVVRQYRDRHHDDPPPRAGWVRDAVLLLVFCAGTFAGITFFVRSDLPSEVANEVLASSREYLDEAEARRIDSAAGSMRRYSASGRRSIEPRSLLDLAVISLFGLGVCYVVISMLSRSDRMSAGGYREKNSGGILRMRLRGGGYKPERSVAAPIVRARGGAIQADEDSAWSKRLARAKGSADPHHRKS